MIHNQYHWNSSERDIKKKTMRNCFQRFDGGRINLSDCYALAQEQHPRPTSVYDPDKIGTGLLEKQ
jgi:hypothetical protein